jgi:hypothetical protein
MYAKYELLWKVLIIGLLGIVGLTGCGVDVGTTEVTPSLTSAPPETVAIQSPEAARDVALAFIRTYHPGSGPSKDAFWFDEEANPEDTVVGLIALNYRYESWLITVIFPEEAPEARIYNVTVEGAEQGFYWQGLVDAGGEVEEVSFVLDDSEPTAPVATSTPIPSQTATAPPTETASSTPTMTEMPTTTPTRTGTPIAEPCNAAAFVEDVTVPDGSTFPQKTNFTKVWRLKNVGTCDWTSFYDLVFVDGNRMGEERVKALQGLVRPGESVDISVDLQAPEDPGNYEGLWMLRDPGGVLFGIGGQADEPFWVRISVVNFNANDYELDFALNYCAANWESETERLSCPGISDSPGGFVQLLFSADLENRAENEPTLWVHPNEARYGWVEGTFPSYRIRDGDHFLAWVGCIGGYNRCSLIFYLDYIDSFGKQYRLGEWLESYDGDVTEIYIDLSDLAGERVRFILGVEANTRNVTDAHGFWFVPRIDWFDPRMEGQVINP